MVKLELLVGLVTQRHPNVACGSQTNPYYHLCAKPDAAWGGDVWKKPYDNSAKSVDTIESTIKTDPEMNQQAAAKEACRDDE
jgi:hypothetical protein